MRTHNFGLTLSHLLRTSSGSTRRALRSVVALGAIALVAQGCTPNYPRCENDKHCAARGEVCVNGQCQECREQSQCTSKYPHEHRVCMQGRCELESDCTMDADCHSRGHGWVCKKGRCAPECQSDAECGSKRQCVAHKCVVQCVNDAECPGEGVCLEGYCSDEASDLSSHHSCRPTQPGDVVALPTVNFEFNQFDLTAASREALAQVMRCMAQAPRNLNVVVEGHCDDRGTQEYNLALGERRAQAVMKYLITLGAEPSRLRTVSKGENDPLCNDTSETCFAQNRRVSFTQSTGGAAN